MIKIPIMTGLRQIIFISFLFSGCAALFGWNIHAPGTLSGEFFTKVMPQSQRVALYFDQSLAGFVSKNKGGITADPQTYYAGEALAPMLIEGFQYSFEEFVLFEREPTVELMKQYRIDYLVAVKIRQFNNQVTWKGQRLELVTESAVFDQDLKLQTRFESRGSSDAKKVFAKKGGPEVNLNAALEYNAYAIIQHLQDWIGKNQ